MTVAILFCEISKTRKDERGEASEEEEEKKRSLKEDDAPYYILDLIHSSLDLKRARSLDKETKRFIA
jgi:hypothetical protein